MGTYIREVDTLEIIANARELEAEAFNCGGDPLEIALEIIWGHGFHDDQAGATDTVGHVFRVGRHVLETDSQGFKTVHSFGTVEAAQMLVNDVDAQEAGLDIEPH